MQGNTFHIAAFLQVKFEKHYFNISRDIVHSVFCNLSYTPYDVITFLICIIEKRQYL